MKTKIVVEYSEIFFWAKRELKVEWNRCCDILHGTELLPFRGAKDFYLSELKADVDPTNKYGVKDPDKIEGIKIVIAFMSAHNVKEMMVTGDGN